MIFLTDLPVNIFEYLLEGSPWGVSVLMLFLYLQERKYAKELTDKMSDMLSLINNFKEKIDQQSGQWKEVTQMGMRIEQLLSLSNEIKRIIEK